MYFLFKCFIDCVQVYSLDYSIRTKNFPLRQYVIKKSLPLFEEVNKIKYVKLSVEHLVDVMQMNEYDLCLYKYFWAKKCENSEFYVANDEYIGLNFFFFFLFFYLKILEFVNRFLTKNIKKITTTNIKNISVAADFIIFLKKKVNKLFSFWEKNISSKNQFILSNFKKETLILSNEKYISISSCFSNINLEDVVKKNI
jgi:hypothetical protein